MARDVIDLRLFTFIAQPRDITSTSCLAFVTEGASITERFDTVAMKFARCYRIIRTGILTECFEMTRFDNAFIDINFTVLALEADSAFTGVFTWDALGAYTFVLARIWVALINDFITIGTSITVGTFTVINARR
tara:strand:+ start:2004 stop:2405 length:402 start_codon:yes stop_codon:yes gene_type:complete